MPFATMGEFVSMLEKNGELARVKAKVSAKMKRLPDLIKMASFPPKVVKNGICQQVILEGEKADLNRLPLIQCWPLDGDLSSGQVMDSEAAARVCERGTGKYITFGGI